MCNIVHTNVHPKLVDGREILLYVEELFCGIAYSFRVKLEHRMRLFKFGEGLVEFRDPWELL